MRQAFPHRAQTRAATRRLPGAGDLPAALIDDYGRLETEILEPMEQAYEIVREIGTGISHHWGAFG